MNGINREWTGPLLSSAFPSLSPLSLPLCEGEVLDGALILRLCYSQQAGKHGKVGGQPQLLQSLGSRGKSVSTHGIARWSMRLLGTTQKWEGITLRSNVSIFATQHNAYQKGLCRQIATLRHFLHAFDLHANVLKTGAKAGAVQLFPPFWRGGYTAELDTAETSTNAPQTVLPSYPHSSVSLPENSRNRNKAVPLRCLPPTCW